LVVGAHRSGTSAVAGALGALGFTVPSLEDRMDWPESNPEHWESLSLSVYNEDLLHRLGGSWDGPPELDEGWPESPAMADLPDPEDLLASAFLGSGPAVWKDPRVCLLLDYWRKVLVGPVAAVLVWRAPLAVAHSLWKRDQMALTDGLALWERYNRSALAGLDGVDSYVVDYRSIVEDPKQFVGDVAGWLGSLDQFSDRVEGWDPAKAAASIDHDLQHQTADDGSGDDGELQDEQRQLVDQLTALRGGHRPLVPGSIPAESPIATEVIRLRRELGRLQRELAVRDTTREELAAAQAELDRTRVELSNAYEYLASTRDALDKSNETIVNMRESTSWRLTKPVRSVMSIGHGSTARPGPTD
jgi:hypothetical protein